MQGRGCTVPLQCYHDGMKRHDIIGKGSDLRVHAAASTRAGLLAACLQGLFEAAAATVVEGSETLERPFTKEAGDFGMLLGAVLDEALADAAAEHETYTDVKFTLITDKKAVGSFVGKKVSVFAALPKQVAPGAVVEKNGDGEWETTISFGK